MRYANTKYSHSGIGVEARVCNILDNSFIRIVDPMAGEIHVQEKAQLVRLIKLLKDASITGGWGAIK